MEFIDLLKVGANKQEAVIAYNKISEPTIEYYGININAISVLLMICTGILGYDPDVDADMFGVYTNDMFTLGKNAFDSTFGDVLHEGTYNFFTDTASIDEEILSYFNLGKGGNNLNLTARVVRHPYLEIMMRSKMDSQTGIGMEMSIYSIIPDDIYINIMLKDYLLQYLFGDSDFSCSDLDLTSLLIISSPPIGIPVVVMSGDTVNQQFGEESVVMYGMGFYEMLLNTLC